MLTLSITAPCLQLCNIVANKNVTWKNVESEKSGLSRGFRRGKLVVRRTCIKVAVCLCPTAYWIFFFWRRPSFLASFGAFSFFWQLFWGRVTSNVRHVCDKVPSGVHQSRFLLLSNWKIASKSPQNSSMFEIAAILWRQVDTKSPWYRR